MTTVIEAIDAAIAKNNPGSVGRRYLGCSAIGEECERKLWYSFHWVDRSQWEPRMVRLLSRGHTEEALLNGYLRDAGIEVHDVDEDTGEQWEFSACGGHLLGHADGFVRNLPDSDEWHLLEEKTANQKSFDRTKKLGVQVDKPMHYSQMQIYMYLADLQFAAYLVVNKNTDELYFERVPANKTHAELLLAKAERIIASSEPPERMTDDPTFFKCSWCEYKELCHYSDRTPQTNCRTCAHSTPLTDGDARWLCEKHQKDLTIPQQKEGCEDHLFMPALLKNWAETTDAGDDFVEYKNLKTETIFRNGKNDYASAEITACENIKMIGDANIDQLRNTFDGKLQ